MNERQRKEVEILNAALERGTPAERAAYLAAACAGDDGLRRQVETLLRLQGDADDFFATVASGEGASLSGVEQPGDQIGRYKLLEKLGEGGFGVVYMAEQREPVKRKVALKVIKMGMDTREVVARFEAERQALALMDHPNIAKVLDGGVIGAAGSEISNLKSDILQPRPYFVMELVRGIRITEYCDQNQLGLEERLNLFLPVCHAVQHAHQKGIIHRDLKPSNILVTLHDGVPVPKVIDFGIAKATQQELTEKTLFTQFHQFLGTPSYMSPEQAELSGLDIDTRADIYSLGVLLYELLVGQPPFDGQALLKAGLDEMRRTLREVEPARPSTRLTSDLAASSRGPTAGATTAAAASRRRLPAKDLAQRLRGDLDWIVMKCLEKDRAHRYETANALAADIQRHLSNEPVMARPPSAAYRLQKMVRRNKVAFTALGAVAAALLIGLGLATFLLVKERAARARAVAEQQRAERAEQMAATEAKRAADEAATAKAVSEFLRNDLLSAASSRYQADVLQKPANPDLKVAEVLDRAAERIGEQFRDQPLVEASIRYTIATSYRDLGDNVAAIPHLERALQLRRASLGAAHEETRFCLETLGRAYNDERQLNQAVALFEELLRLESALGRRDDPRVLRTMKNLGACYAIGGRFAEGIRLLEEGLKLSDARYGRTNWNTVFLMNALGVAYFQAGQNEKSIALDEQALAILRTGTRPDDPLTILTLDNLAGGYRQAGKPEQAVPLFEEALKLRKTRFGVTHPDTLSTAEKLAAVYRSLGRAAEARALSQEFLEANATLVERTARRRVPSLRRLAEFFAGQGRSAEAQALYVEAVEGARQTSTANPQLLEEAMGDLGEFFYRQSRLLEAEPIYRELVALRSARLRPGSEERLSSIASLGRLLSDLAWAEHIKSAATNEIGVPTSTKPRLATPAQPLAPAAAADPRTPAELAHEAEKLLREVVQARIAITNLMRWRVADGESRLGAALVAVAATDSTLSAEARRAKLAEAETLLRNANAILQESKPIDRKYQRDSLVRLERLNLAWPKPDQAAQARQNLEAFHKTRADPKAEQKAGP